MARIEFSPPEQPYPPDYLSSLLPLKPNTPLRLADVRASIERLFATGRYSDIDVDAELAGNGLVVRFITQRSYFVGRITSQGVPEPPNKGVLANATRLELGTPYSEKDLNQAVANLSQVLQANGFFEAHIAPQFEHDPRTQQVQINFVIQPGKRARYSQPAISGNPERPLKEIVDATHWRGWLGWKPVTETRTQDGLYRIRQSYRKQDRMMAQVNLESMNYDDDTNRVAPSIQARGGPKVNIEVVGAKVSRGKLRRMVPVYEEQSVDRGLLLEGANNLQDYFESEGYFDVKVSFESQSPSPGLQVIRYTIQRGQRHKVAAVVIGGNRYFGVDTIRERMFIREAGLLEYRYGRFSDALLETDTSSIVSLYRSNGFRDVEVATRVERDYRGKENSIAVHFEIKEGPQWLVTKLDLVGVSAENDSAVRPLLQETDGQPFSDLTIAVDRDTVLEYYYNHGYPDAAFAWSFAPAGRPNQVSLKYVVTEGPKKFVRSVLLSGLRTTDPGLVSERVMLSPGQPLSRADMLETQRRLYNLGIFAKVDIALQNPAGEERDKHVLLNVDEASKYSVSGGVGAELAKIGGCSTCLDAPVGTAGFSPRVYFGLTRRNMFGDGHIASFNGRVSNLHKRVLLSYQAPQFRGSPNINLLFSGLWDDSRDVRTFSARTAEGTVQIGQRLSRATQMLYRFSYRRVGVDRNSLQINPLLIPLLAQPVRVGMPAISFIQDRRDDPTNAHRGIYTTLDLGWASRVFGSQTNFTRALGHNATYYPFGLGSRYVLARDTTFGWLRNASPGTEIPLPERFFAGGASSLRGFSENQAGPRDPLTGFPLGGNALLLNQVEFRFPVIGENITGVLFEDAGNVYSRVQNLSFRVKQRGVDDFDYMIHAVGFGIRYRTPVGPVRLDLAYAINPPRFVGFKGTREELLFGGGVRTLQQLSHFQFHFSLGQAF